MTMQITTARAGGAPGHALCGRPSEAPSRLQSSAMRDVLVTAIAPELDLDATAKLSRVSRYMHDALASRSQWRAAMHKAHMAPPPLPLLALQAWGTAFGPNSRATQAGWSSQPGVLWRLMADGHIACVDVSANVAPRSLAVPEPLQKLQVTDFAVGHDGKRAALSYRPPATRLRTTALVDLDAGKLLSQYRGGLLQTSRDLSLVQLRHPASSLHVTGGPTLQVSSHLLQTRLNVRIPMPDTMRAHLLSGERLMLEEHRPSITTIDCTQHPAHPSGFLSGPAFTLRFLSEDGRLMGISAPVEGDEMDMTAVHQTSDTTFATAVLGTAFAMSAQGKFALTAIDKRLIHIYLEPVGKNRYGIQHIDLHESEASFDFDNNAAPQATWSDDMRRVAVRLRDAVYVLDIATNKVARHAVAPAMVGGPQPGATGLVASKALSWSPDAQFLLVNGEPYWV